MSSSFYTLDICKIRCSCQMDWTS